MEHPAALIETVAIGLVAAFLGGVVAQRLRLPVIVGYLIAGVAVGPFTPGLVADPGTSKQLAELGVILLMFGVGIHFSPADLLAVRSVAIPGAIGQIATATVLGIGVGAMIGWDPVSGLLLGLSVSVASTVVLLRALEARRELETPHGRIAIGWLIVEDLFTVLTLVLLPSIAPLLLGQEGDAGSVARELLLATVKLVAFAGLMLVVGKRIAPRLLRWVRTTRSRELFTLAVLSIAIGIAVIAYVAFGVSFALGAFLAGVALNESEVSHDAAQEALPLRDAFAVLFFVSVGMLFDPGYLVEDPIAVLSVSALVVLGKGLPALFIAALLRRPLRVSLTVAVALSQIGEFSFILATLALALGLLPQEAFQLIVAAAIVSITVNPLLFRAIDPVERWVRVRPKIAALLDPRAPSSVGRARRRGR